MIKLVCDACGAEIKKDEKYFRLWLLTMCDGASVDLEEIKTDYCAKCAIKKIESYNEGPEIKETKEATPVKRPKEFDLGKALALHRAGWSYQQIADEMGWSVSTVYKNITEARREKHDE